MDAAGPLTEVSDREATDAFARAAVDDRAGVIDTAEVLQRGRAVRVVEAVSADSTRASSRGR